MRLALRWCHSAEFLACSLISIYAPSRKLKVKFTHSDIGGRQQNETESAQQGMRSPKSRQFVIPKVVHDIGGMLERREPCCQQIGDILLGFIQREPSHKAIGCEEIAIGMEAYRRKDADLFILPYRQCKLQKGDKKHILKEQKEDVDHALERKG